MSYNLKCCSFYPNNFDASALPPTEVYVYSDRGTCVPRPRCDDFFKAMATEDGPMLAKDECRKVCGGGRLWSRQRCNG